MTEIDTDKLTKLHAEATPAPWTYDPDKSSFVQALEGRADIVELDGWPVEYRNEEIACGEIIAYLRSHVPAILAMAEENKRLREALGVCRDVLFPMIPRLGPEGPDSTAEKREYEEIGGAWSMAERALEKDKV